MKKILFIAAFFLVLIFIVCYFVFLPVSKTNVQEDFSEIVQNKNGLPPEILSVEASPEDPASENQVILDDDGSHVETLSPAEILNLKVLAPFQSEDGTLLDWKSHLESSVVNGEYSSSTASVFEKGKTSFYRICLDSCSKSLGFYTYYDGLPIRFPLEVESTLSTYSRFPNTFTPNGEYYLYIRLNEATREPELKAYHFSTGERHRLMSFSPNTEGISTFGWSPNNEKLAFVVYSGDVSYAPYWTKLYVLGLNNQAQILQKDRYLIPITIQSGNERTNSYYGEDFTWIDDMTIQYVDSEAVGPSWTPFYPESDENVLQESLRLIKVR